ncbi:MAG: peptide chain release factor N(5)-glutamine methyltransferase [Pirellulales bacterium]|nr:peptide chain release factor N(5)-glutamine methyltransferase [Pirellulales bacterium]
MTEQEAWTIGRLLQWTTGYLKERGAESPRLEAEVLLAHACGCKRIDLYTRFDEIPAEPVRAAFRELVRRRAEGTPVAYLVGRREFYSLSFRVTPDVLIPRPETEFLLIRLLDLAATHQPAGEALQIADVGTGSGVLAICAARKLAGCRVTAIDRSPAALAVARANAEEHGVLQQIVFREGDLLAGLPEQPQFHFIVSNPPYVSEAEYAKLPREIREHEPRGALVAGPGGTEVIFRLIPQAACRLLEGGWLLLEVSPMIEPAVREELGASNSLILYPTIKDLAGLPRVVQARKRPAD